MIIDDIIIKKESWYKVKNIIKKELKEMADIKYLEFQKKICFTEKEILGVRIPKLRKYAKELLKKYKIEKILKSIDDKYYEEIMLEGILIGIDSNKDICVVENRIEKFISKIDNWAICDTFCAGLKITNKYMEEMWDFLQKFLKSDKEFEIRFGIVMIINYYINEKYLNQIFKIFNNIKNNGYYAKMAVSWGISICLIKYYDKTITYLKHSKIDKFTYNKALQKAIESYRINEIHKKELRKMKNVVLQLM